MVEPVVVAALVGAARRGDREAFAELMRRHQELAHGYALSLLQHPQLAQDATQDAFIAAYVHLEQLSVPEQFPAWLCGIVRHQCARLRRGRQVSTVPLDAAAAVASPDLGPEQAAEHGERQAAVGAAVAALPAPLRAVTVLFYGKGYPQREVATFLGLPVTVVNNRLHRARQQLREEMLAMVKETFEAQRLPEDFTRHVGEVIATRGPLVEARFAPEVLPGVLSALAVVGAEVGAVTVVQHLGAGVIRGLAAGTPPSRGDRLADTGRPVAATASDATVAQAIAHLRRPVRAQLLETGIKVIDLFCPVVAGAAIGIFGDGGTGKVVTLWELLHHLAGSPDPVTLLDFVSVADEVLRVQGSLQEGAATERARHDTAQAAYIPVHDAARFITSAAVSALDVWLYFSRDLAQARRYPAIDPLRSTSRWLTPALVGDAHVALAAEARELLRRCQDLRALPPEARGAEEARWLRRGERLAAFLTQPFFVAEPFTGRPGQVVPREALLRSLRALLDGAFDTQSVEQLRWRGALE